MFFKDIELNSKKELDPYFDLVDMKLVSTVLVLYICGNMFIRQDII